MATRAMTANGRGMSGHFVDENVARDLHSAVSRNVLQMGKRKSYPAREVIYREHDEISRVYCIRKGLVKLVRYLPNGRGRIVRLHTRNQWIGLEGLIGQVYEHTAIPVYEVEVEHFSIQNLERLARENPHMLGQLLCQWHDHLVQADKWISDFSTGGIKPRVARLLEYLAELEYGRPIDRVRLLSVFEIAEILGVTQESVSRVLAAFKRCRVLQKQAGSEREMYRLDTEKLRLEAQK